MRSNTCVFPCAGHETQVSPLQTDIQGEQQHDDIIIPPTQDIPSPGSKVIEALVEEKDASSSPHGETEDVQIIGEVGHDSGLSMKELAEKQQETIESEAKVKVEIEAAKSQEQTYIPLKIKLPGAKTTIVVSQSTSDTSALEDEFEEEGVPLQKKKYRKRR